MDKDRVAGSAKIWLGLSIGSGEWRHAVLQKTGTMAEMRRDLQHGGLMNHQIWDTETLRLTQEAR